MTLPSCSPAPPLLSPSARRERRPLLFALLAFLGGTAGIALLVLAENGGRFVFPLDDSWIHLAMARNVAEHGVWGLTRHHFSSTTSSPLWTGLIAAGFAVLGVQEWIPAVAGVLFGAILLILIHSILAREPVCRFPAAVALGATLIFPLPLLAL